MSDRVSVEVGDLSEKDIFGELVSCLTVVTHLIETISSTYQSSACFEALAIIEDSFMKAFLQMERTRLLLRKLIESLIVPGTQGAFWFSGKCQEKKQGKGKQAPK